MDVNIEIWCTKCNSKMDTSESVYCESCIDAKDEELQGLEGEIESLNRIIAGLENEKERLHEELMEYRT